MGARPEAGADELPSCPTGHLRFRAVVHLRTRRPPAGASRRTRRTGDV